MNSCPCLLITIAGIFFFFARFYLSWCSKSVSSFQNCNYHSILKVRSQTQAKSSDSIISCSMSRLIGIIFFSLFLLHFCMLNKLLRRKTDVTHRKILYIQSHKYQDLQLP